MTKQTASALATAWPLPGIGAPSHAASRPNIILILADDLGWRDVGFSGNTFVEAPHIDRLAREGVRFTRAYSAALRRELSDWRTRVSAETPKSAGDPAGEIP